MQPDLPIENEKIAIMGEQESLENVQTDPPAETYERGDDWWAGQDEIVQVVLGLFFSQGGGLKVHNA